MSIHALSPHDRNEPAGAAVSRNECHEVLDWHHRLDFIGFHRNSPSLRDNHLEWFLEGTGCCVVVLNDVLDRLCA